MSKNNIEQFFACVSRNEQLTELNIRASLCVVDLKFGQEKLLINTLPHIINLLKSLPSLTVLDFSCNDLSILDIKQFKPKLPDNV